MTSVLADCSTETLALRLTRDLVGRRTGVVRRLVRVPPTLDGTGLCEAGCEVAFPDPDRQGESILCGGAGSSWEEAVVRCLGEGVERYCAAQSGTAELCCATIKDLRTSAIDLKQLTLFADCQYMLPGFPFSPMDDSSELHWVSGRSLSEDCKVFIPATLVFLPFLPPLPEPPVTPTISTGLACHTDPEEAICAALLETIERDAVCCTWLARLSPPVIPEENSHRNNLVPGGAERTLYEITSDIGIPVVLALLRGESTAGRTLCIGTGAGLTRQQAVEKASLEAAMSWTYTAYLNEHKADWKPGKEFENVMTFGHHAQLYTGRPELEKAFDFLDRSGRKALPEVEPDKVGAVKGIARCIEGLRACGIDAAVYDLTTEDIAEIGLNVVRVVCPGLQPLHGNHNLPFLGNGRLWNVSRHFDFADEDPTWETLNPYPHPSA